MSYTTQKSLLESIRNGDEISWHTFYETYRPLIILRGQDFHLLPEEMEDLCQMVVIDIFKSVPHFHYDRKKGKFRDYLRAIITHNALDIIRRRGWGSSAEKDSLPPDDFRDEMSALWDDEWRGHILKQAMQVLRTKLESSTYQAFELYALKGESAEAVAAFLGVPVNAVYVAKCRAMPKLRDIIKKLKEE